MKIGLRIGCLVGLICLWGGGLAWGQEIPKPGPEHEYLKAQAGTWDAVVKAGGPEQSKATVTSKLIAGGLWLVTDFRGSFGGIPFEGHGIDGYDPQKKKYVSTWVDSMSTTPMQFEGTYDSQAKKLTMIGTGIGPDGRPAKYKSVTQHVDARHMNFQMFVVDGNDQDSPMMTIEYTKKD